jgi:hypothetical protein
VATGSVELFLVDLNHPVEFVHTVPGPGHKWTALVQCIVNLFLALDINGLHLYSPGYFEYIVKS